MIGASPRTQPRSPISSEAFAGDFVLTLWTDDPALAFNADRAGIQRVGLDLERLGKAERQEGFGTWVSPHGVERLAGVRSALRTAQLFARTEPLHDRSEAEVELLLELGVEVLMLPMFGCVEEVAQFMSLVDGRAAVVPLLETCSAAEQIEEIVAIDGLEETHVGINDLAISLGSRTRFEVLLTPVIERVASAVCGAGLRLGIGAIGRVDDYRLPVATDLIYARLVQLGAGASLIARSFAAPAIGGGRLAFEVARSRRRLHSWRAAGDERHWRAYVELREAVARCAAW